MNTRRKRINMSKLILKREVVKVEQFGVAVEFDGSFESFRSIIELLTKEYKIDIVNATYNKEEEFAKFSYQSNKNTVSLISLRRGYTFVIHAKHFEHDERSFNSKVFKNKTEFEEYFDDSEDAMAVVIVESE